MYRKLQGSGFTEIIPLICTSVICSQYPVFLHPEFPQGSPEGVAAVWWMLSSVQLSHVWLFATPWTATHQASLVYHQLPELAQTHVHRVGDAIQPSHPLSSPSPPAFNLFQHQSFPMSRLFASGGQSIRASASVLPMNIQWWFPLGWTGWISVQSKGLSRVFPTPQFESINFLVLSLLYGKNT